MAGAPELPLLSFDDSTSPFDTSPTTSVQPLAVPHTSGTKSKTKVTAEERREIADDEMKLLKKKPKAANPNRNDPTHPIRSMQDAFVESLIEATNGGIINKTKLRDGDAETRWSRLIAQSRDAAPPAFRWRYRDGQKQHELWKLMAQISFGVYLLLNGMAKQDEHVVSILQNHIDEIDEFLEVVMEDFERASSDLTERIEYMRLPMEHIEVFERLLEDRSYRAELIENCELIEHILCRTNASLRQYRADIKEGMQSTKEFTIYLAGQSDDLWRTAHSIERGDSISGVYDAMKCNAEGWYKAFVDLDVKAKKLDALVSQLDDVIIQVQKTAGEVSRRTWASIEPFSLPFIDDGLSSVAPPPSTTSNQSSTPRATSTRDSVSTINAGSSLAFNRLTIRSALPPPLENPFADPKAEPAKQEQEDEKDQDEGVVTVEEVGQETAEEATEEGVYDEPEHEVEEEEADVELGHEPLEDGPLYILQPRTYTPALPEPLPSPMVKDHPPITIPIPSLADNDMTPTSPGLPKRSSLRQRVSLKANPPESIQIPPLVNPYQRPRTSSKVQQQPPDSAYGSDIERNRGSTTTAEMSPPIHGHVMPSPLSDQPMYHPLRASPHSPLQQRPHTSHNTPRVLSNPNSAYYPHHVRNAPSRQGGASLLSNVTSATYETSAPAEPETGKRLKKKRSAFGWLKKAFSLSEDEKAAFEARKATPYVDNPYLEGRSSKFLDGRRVHQPTGTR